MTNFTLLSVMKYLKQNQYQESWLSLQNQSQIKLFTYPKEIQFFRKIVLKGDFNQSTQFISTLQSYLGERAYKNASMTIYKQKLYELVNTPDQRQLKRLFQKQIVNFCTQEQYQNLFTLLTCRKTQQIQGLKDWTVMKGRLKVFEQVLPMIQGVLCNSNTNLSNHKPNNYSHVVTPQLNLDEAVAIYLEKSNLKAEELPGLSSNFANKSQISQLNSYVDKSFVKSPMIQSLLRSDKKQLQFELSQSQYERSQFVGGFDKKARLHPTDNLPNTGQMQGQSVRRSMQLSSLTKQPTGNYSQTKGEHPGSKLYQQQQINQISQQEQRSDTVRSVSKVVDKSRVQALNRLSKYHERQQQPQNNRQSQSQMQSQQERHNIEYLEQTNSIVYNNQMEQHCQDQENFTFSQHNLRGEEPEKPREIVKLATISDNKAIRTCRFSNSGGYFAVGTNSSILKIFDVEELFAENKHQQIKPIYEINGLHSKSIFCLDWARDECSMVTCSNDLTIKLTQFNQQFTSHQVSVIGRHESSIRMVKFNEQQNKIFSCGDDSLIKVWDMGKVKRCYNLKGHSAGISAFKISQSQNQLYSVSKDSTIKRWDLRTLECISTSKPQQSQMTFIANNTQRIAVSNRNGNILFFDPQLNLQYEVKIHQEQIRSIQASKSQDLYLTASFDGHLGIFSQKTIHSPDYFQHNQNSQDKVVFATFLDHSQFRGFASTSTLGLCHIYSYS